MDAGHTERGATGRGGRSLAGLPGAVQILRHSVSTTPASPPAAAAAGGAAVRRRAGRRGVSSPAVTAADDDATLLQAWRAGDRAAGQALFERYYPAVARFFLNKAGDASPELIQQTFLGCVEGLAGFRGEGSFRSWLFSIAYRRLCKHYETRAGDREDLGSVSVEALDPTASRVIGEREEQGLLLRALRSVPLELQVVLELHYWEGCQVVEIAAVVGVPEGTVKSRLRRGRERLREAIERLARSPALARDTLHGLETWARQIRERLARGGP